MLVVAADNQAQYRPVRLGPVVDGLRVSEEGLKSGEKIILKGLVRPGMQVTPRPTPMQQPTATASAAAASAAADPVEARK